MICLNESWNDCQIIDDVVFKNSNPFYFTVEPTPSTSTSASTSASAASSTSSSHPLSIPVKRGPGRPRLKPTGPTNQGYRGTPRPRKPVGPLVVPLGQSHKALAQKKNDQQKTSNESTPSPKDTQENRLGFYQSLEEDV